MSAGGVPPLLDARILLSWPEGTRRRRELSPLVFSLLEREGRLDALDDAARREARDAWVQTLGRSVAIGDTLLRVVDAAEAEGERALPLKGSLLAFTVYPEAAARPMNDVDVAIAPRAVDAVASRLERAGWRREGVGQRRFALTHHHHVMLRRAGAPTIELHARLLHELGADGSLDALLERAVCVPLLGRNLWVPTWEDHAFYIALHAATHGLADSPLWLADLAFVAPRVQLPARIGEEATARRARAALHFALAIARRYLPSLALESPPPAARALRAAALFALLGHDPLGRRPPHAVLAAARLVLTDRARDAVRAVVDKAMLRATERWLERPAGTDTDQISNRDLRR